MAAQGYERPLVLDALSGLDIFEGSDKEALTPLADTVSGRVTLDAGEQLCAEGGAAENWWIVLDGTADVTSGGVKVGSIGPQETVGELALFDGGPHSATVTAADGLDVLVFDKDGFIDVVTGSPPLALALLRSASQRLRATNALV